VSRRPALAPGGRDSLWRCQWLQSGGSRGPWGSWAACSWALGSLQPGPGQLGREQHSQSREGGLGAAMAGHGKQLALVVGTPRGFTRWARTCTGARTLLKTHCG
jgi:hypothetical protein